MVTRGNKNFEVRGRPTNIHVGSADAQIPSPVVPTCRKPRQVLRKLLHSGLEWATRPTYSPCMRTIWLVLCLIVLTFCGVVYAACRSWRKMGAGKRTAGVLLLSPHFLLIVAIVVSLLCGHPPQGSRCFNTQFLCGVLIVFILPVPALVGTITAFIMFKLARTPVLL